MKKTIIISTLVLAGLALIAWTAVGAPFGHYGQRGNAMQGGNTMQGMQGTQGMRGMGYQNNMAALPTGTEVKAVTIDKGLVLTLTATEPADVTALKEAYTAALEKDPFAADFAAPVNVISKEVDQGLELTVTSEDAATVQHLQFAGDRIALHVLHGTEVGPRGPGQTPGTAYGPGGNRGRMANQDQVMMNGATREQMQQMMRNLTPEQRQIVRQGMMQNQESGTWGRGMGRGPAWANPPTLEESPRGE